MMKSMRSGSIMKTNKRGKLSLAMVDADVSMCRAFAAWAGGARGVRSAGIYHSGESALAALPAKKPHLVLLEVKLPGLGGIACLSRLQPRLPETRFIIYTHTAEAEDVFAALAAGADGYYLKSTLLAELLAGIQKTYCSHGVQDISRAGAALKVLEYYHQMVPPPEALRFPRRQQDVLDLMVRGWSTPQIAEALRLTCATVETHTRRIFKKLGVHSRAQAMAKIAETRSLKIVAANPAGAGKTVPAGQKNGGITLQIPPLRPLWQPETPAAQAGGFKPAGRRVGCA